LENSIFHIAYTFHVVDYPPPPADVFVYSGELEGVFKGAAQSLKKGGWFAMTLERLFRNSSATADAAGAADTAGGKKKELKEVTIKGEALGENSGEGLSAKEYSVSDEDLKKGWKLQLSGRFAHTEEYVGGLAAANGFKVLYHEHFIPRKDQGLDIPGQLVVLQLTK
jgi:predicted TPR repeat methyltransferase